MRVAALDLGSNSFHLLVADVHRDGTFEAVAREKEMLRLGDAVSRTGRVGEPLADRAVACVRRLRGVADAAGAVDVLAKATSAIRSAADGSDLVDRIEAETGVDVEVIGGLEEARLIFGAIRASVVLDPGPALCLDVGGGSVELMVGDATGLRWARSENLGVARLTADHVHSDPVSKGDRRRLEAFLDSQLTPLAEEVAPLRPRMAVGTSGTLGDLVAMASTRATGARPASRNQLTVTRDQIEVVHAEIVASDARDRRRLPELDERRVELIVAGSTLLVVAMRRFDLPELTFSEWALREGIVLDAVGTHDPDDWSDDPRAIRRAAVAGLARRCSSDIAHTEQVARLALSIFDQTGDLHQLGPADRELLEDAALLHDIGQHVSRKGHHKHAAYLVEHGGLRGFSPGEVARLAAVVRHHRRGEPKPSEPLYGALSPEERERVRRLAAILRVADGLDRGRRGAVEAVDVQTGENLVILRLDAPDDVELEQWGARRRRALFESVFDRELELVVRAPTATA